jgi:hypothetical protein
MVDVAPEALLVAIAVTLSTAGSAALIAVAMALWGDR